MTQPQYSPITGYGTKAGEWEFTQQGWQPIVSSVSVEKSKELLMGSSDLGKNVVADSVKTEKVITPLQQTPEQRAQAYKDAGVKLPEEKPPTGISGADILTTGGNISDYDQNKDGFYTPKREKTPDELQFEREQAEVQTAKNDYQDAVNQLQTFDISKDPQYQNIVASITSQWDSRIRQMERTNASRRASLLQTGIRLGSRYTEAITGGIITAEEREGMSRIGELESQKQSAIAAARAAYQKQEWDKYSDFIDLAEKKYNMEVKEVDDLNKKVMEENKTREEKIEKINNELNIKTLFDSGITESSDIQSFLKEKGINVDLKFIDDTLKIINPDESLAGVTADLKTFKMFFPDVDITTSEGRQEYLNWQTQVGEATRKTADPTSYTEWELAGGQQGTGMSYSNWLTRKDKEDKEDLITISTADKQKLLGVGFIQSDIISIEKDINQYGLEKTLEGISDEKQKKVITEIYGREDTKEFLTKDYFTSIFTDDQLKKSAEDAGFRGTWTSWNTEKENYLNYLEKIVKQYREAGYTDKEILKMMQ